MLAGCATSYRSKVEGLRPASAHWIDATGSFAPSTLWGHFSFESLSFPSPTEGWIVGDRFVLHVKRRGLSVTFLEPTGSRLKSVDFRTPDDGWAAGSRLGAGVVWHYANGRWSPSDLGIDRPDWYARRIWVSPEAVWTEVGVVLKEDLQPGPSRRTKSVLLRSSGTAWQVDDSPGLEEHSWSFRDACFYSSSDGWFVGFERAEPRIVRALAVRRLNGEWRRDWLTELSGPRADLRQVVCLPENRAVALGISGGGMDGPGQPVLLRHDGERWQRIELPEAFRRAEVGAVAALSDSDVWLAVSNVVALRDDRATFLHWSGGEWTEVAAPSLPGGRAIAYYFSDMQFVSPTEGWAIANVYKGRGMARGLIFHYRDGVWRNRNWSWHFWNEPWFGLAGY